MSDQKLETPKSTKSEAQPSQEKNRNTSSSEPLDNKELLDNLASADSGLEKPPSQES